MTGPPADEVPEHSAHQAALTLLRSWQPPTPSQERARQLFLAHLEAHPDGLSRTCFPDHLTASTVVFSADHRSVLLTLHAKANAWFQLGGHCEETDVDLASTAMREALEESGLEGIALDPGPVQLDAHDVGFCSPRGTVRHLDVRFLAVAVPGAHAASEESLDVTWWPFDALPTTEPSLLELVRMAQSRLTGRKG